MLRWTVLVRRAAGEANVSRVRRGNAWCGFALALGVAAAPLHPWLTAARATLRAALPRLVRVRYKRGLGAFANLQWRGPWTEMRSLYALRSARRHLPDTG